LHHLGRLAKVLNQKLRADLRNIHPADEAQRAGFTMAGFGRGDQ
jgi:hypothetical protein